MNKYRTTITPKESSGYRFIGIRNTANNCFLNSILQCLFYNKKLTQYVIEGKVALERKRLPDYSQHTVFLNMYKDFMNKMAYGSSVLTPMKLLNYIENYLPSYTKGSQEDAYGILLYILECLDNALSYKAKFVIRGTADSVPGTMYKEAYETLVQFYNKKYSYILESFYGLLITTVDGRRVYEPFNSICLDVATHHSIDRCIDEYFKPKTIDNLQIDTKAWSLPNSLILVLKRLDIKTSVTFPTELDITRVVHQEKRDQNHYVYNLNAVIYHIGTSESGHYYSVCKSSGAWYSFNDESVSKVQNVDVENAYILFYEREFI